MHRTAPPLLLHPLAPLSTWVLVHPALHHLLIPSAHANRAGASGEVDWADYRTHAAGGVAASKWLAVNLGGGVVDTGGTGARISANNDTQSDDDDGDEVSILEVILGQNRPAVER